MPYICIIEMSFHLWENKTEKPKPALVLTYYGILTEKAKQGKQLLGQSVLAQMHWQDSKKRTTAAASAVGSADFCAELFPPCDYW